MASLGAHKIMYLKKLKRQNSHFWGSNNSCPFLAPEKVAAPKWQF
jgi:hypothetical protein